MSNTDSNNLYTIIDNDVDILDSNIIDTNNSSNNNSNKNSLSTKTLNSTYNIECNI